MKDKKNIMIMFLFLAVFSLSIGFAVIGTKINNKDMLTSLAFKWDIGISKVVSVETEGNAKSDDTITDGATFSANISLPSKNDKIIYTLNVKNSGNVDSKLNNIVVSLPDSNLSYSIDGIKASDILRKGENHLFTLTVEKQEESKKNNDLEQGEEEILFDDKIVNLKLMLDFVQN